MQASEIANIDKRSAEEAFMYALSRFSVGAKLRIGFGVVLAAMVVIAVFSIIQLRAVSQHTETIATKHISGVRVALQISEAATRYRVREYRLGLTKPDERAAVVKRLSAAIDAVNKLRQTYEQQMQTDEDKRLYAAFVTSWETYLATSGRFKDALLAGDETGALKIMTSDSLKQFDAAVAALKDLSQYNDKAAQAANEEAAQTADRARNLILLVLALAVGGSVVLSWAISRSITEPLQSALGLAEQVAKGNLTHGLTASGDDEVAKLTRALSGMVNQLRDLVTEVRTGVSIVSSASSEIALGSQDLSERTEQTAARLQQTASSMEQLTGTMTHAADTARQANQLAEHATDAAHRGGDVVTKVVSNMDKITDSSRKIGDIIAVIDGIAFQTNILALNAAVEAARAGEQGRGFAVVASEVRSLAQRSAQAAKEIKGLIGASVETVESGASLVKDAGETMKEIMTSVQRVTDLMGELASAASEQRDGISHVNEAVSNLDQMTQQNAALVEQTAAASSSLKDQSARLNEVVAVFKVEG